MTKPFVDYYRERGISPVKQDVSDVNRHFSRRDALYRQLGIPPRLLRGARVIEFGPGSGHNALFTASLQPAHYVLVDGNPYGVRELRALFAQHGVRTDQGIEIVESLIEDYADESRYSVVLAEGLLAFSYDPPGLARRIAARVDEGGILVMTCSDPASALGEILRRFVARRLIAQDRPPEEQLAILRPVFGPHLQTLVGMSRSVDDWILDNIVHPFTGQLFGFEEAIETVADAFDFYASSPHFVTDWRWYKSIRENGDYNGRATQAYRANVCNLLDYRLTLPPQPPELGERVLRTCASIYGLMQQSEMHGEDVTAPLDGALEDLRAAVATTAPSTAASLASLLEFLRAPAPRPDLLSAFAPFFGRGMQYLSFIRRPGYRT